MFTATLVAMVIANALFAAIVARMSRRKFIPLAYGTGFAVMTATLLVATWWPARRAARLDPVEALVHV